jgi:predicted nucleic acid-binding protein
METPVVMRAVYRFNSTPESQQQYAPYTDVSESLRQLMMHRDRRAAEAAALQTQINDVQQRLENMQKLNRGITSAGRVHNYATISFVDCLIRYTELRAECRRLWKQLHPTDEHQLASTTSTRAKYVLSDTHTHARTHT